MTSLLKVFSNSPVCSLFLRNSSTPILCRLCHNGAGKDPVQYSEPAIPPYEDKIGEPAHVKRARLLYQSRKRGMLENDLLLSGFASKYLPTMTEPQLSCYDRLINLPSNDWEIYYWATGVKETPEEFQTDVMTALRQYVKNENRENRTRMPDL